MTGSHQAPIERAVFERIGADLVKRLGGAWNAGRGQGLCLCPAHADRSPSFSDRIGTTSLLFHRFAGCSNHDVIAALRWVHPSPLSRSEPAAQAPAPVDDTRSRARLARLWDGASPIAGTPAIAYLEHRSIPAGEAGLRFRANTPLGAGQSVQFRPAMIAAVREGSEFVALQRTFLDVRRGRRARDIGMLGRPGRGCVRLAPAFDVLGLAEGVESALSTMILLGLPVWATLGSERFSRVDVPLSIRRLVLLADNDQAGRLAVKAAMDAHAAPGREIEICWPWHGLNDWNDVLRAEGKGVGDRVRHGA